jgi:hypothetical protein
MFHLFQDYLRIEMEDLRNSVGYLDGLSPDGHLRQAKVSALRENDAHRPIHLLGNAGLERERKRRTILPTHE